MQDLEGKIRFVIVCITVAASFLLGYLEGENHARKENDHE